MYKETLVAWSQFEMMMRTGVPHAMDIAAELVRYDLVVPLPTRLEKHPVDLQFYCVIHRAYRAQVLSRFLTAMELLKHSAIWIEIQANQDTQMWIVQLCQAFENMPVVDSAKLILAHLAEQRVQSKPAA